MGLMRPLLAVLVAMIFATWSGSPASAESTPSSDGPWKLPAPNSCQPQSGLRSWSPVEDAGVAAFDVGDRFAVGQLELLRNFLPAAIRSTPLTDRPIKRQVSVANRTKRR
jgi:hypothetical protein